MDRVLAEGCRYLAERRHGDRPRTWSTTEAEGSFRRADPGKVSDRARERGGGQLGTIGSGNHFLEVQRVERIFDRAAAEALGLCEGQLVILIHTGSRGLGHQVCTDYVRAMDEVMARHGIKLPDRELACAPFQSQEGQAYFGAMCAAANFAFANRQAITHAAREVFEPAFGRRGRPAPGLRRGAQHGQAGATTGTAADLCVHRKGATRAFGPAQPGDAGGLPRRRASRCSSPAAWARRPTCWWARTTALRASPSAAPATAPAGP